jgi:hypothetical protein
VKTSTLWATHFEHLNDDAETPTLRPQLLEIMAVVLSQKVKRHNAGIRNQYYRPGGTRPIARNLVANLYPSGRGRKTPQSIMTIQSQVLTFLFSVGG